MIARTVFTKFATWLVTSLFVGLAIVLLLSAASLVYIWANYCGGHHNPLC